MKIRFSLAKISRWFPIVVIRANNSTEADHGSVVAPMKSRGFNFFPHRPRFSSIQLSQRAILPHFTSSPTGCPWHSTHARPTTKLHLTARPNPSFDHFPTRFIYFSSSRFRPSRRSFYFISSAPLFTRIRNYFFLFLFPEYRRVKNHAEIPLLFI